KSSGPGIYCDQAAWSGPGYEWMTGEPELETDGRGGSCDDLAGRNGSGLGGDPTILRDSLLVVSMLQNPRPKGGMLTNGGRPLSIFRLNQHKRRRALTFVICPVTAA